MRTSPHPPDAAAARPGQPLRRLVTGTAWLAALVALLYGVAILWLWLAQERLLFRPERLAADHLLATSADIHESRIAVDGAVLSVLELRLPDPSGVVFYLHGNAGNLASWFSNADFYRRLNFDLVMLDYRGYGKSSGQIRSEAQLHADVKAVWQQVAERYRGRRVVFFGRSLGTGLAAALAAEVQPDLTVLVSPYQSMAQLAREHYPWVPEAALRYPLRSDLWIPRIRRPVLMLHGDRDALIPPHHSQALQRLQPGAQRVLVSGAGHNDLHGFDTYLRTLSAALAGLR